MDILAEVTAVFISSGQTAAMQRPSPGILIFSHSLQLQYANRRALELINTGLTRTESGSFVLPARMLELSGHVRETLDERREAGIYEPFEVSLAVSECGRRLLFRGFGHPNGPGSLDARIIIVLEELKAAEPDPSQQMHAGGSVPEIQVSADGAAVNY